VWSVAQDEASESKAFIERLGGRFPILLDPSLQTAADYGLTTVPTLFWIGRDGIVREAIPGFSKADLNRISESLARELGSPSVLIAPPDDGNPPFRPG